MENNLDGRRIYQRKDSLPSPSSPPDQSEPILPWLGRTTAAALILVLAMKIPVHEPAVRMGAAVFAISLLYYLHHKSRRLH